MVYKLKYGNTNTFLVRGTGGNLLIDTDNANIISTEESRKFLESVGIEGEILSTPSHSEDSISKQ